ncbi:MAG: hypothetical protein ACRERD_02525 [Candidatus Binatia bacterium]
MRYVLWFYLAAGVISVLLFCSQRSLPHAYWVLLALNLFKALLWLQDYRLRLNQHYMALWVTLIFLFLPNKRRLIQYQIVAFYFWAGTLKLNPEWLSGAALYSKPLGVPLQLVPAACAYVLVLELFVVFGLFAKNRWLFWGTFAQLLLFHVTSWTVVGFFYPTLMFGLLSIFPLARLLALPDASPGLRRLLTGREPASTAAFLSAFSLLQILPWFFPGDTAITGEGRLFALHMFDARIVCEAQATLHGTNGRTMTRPIILGLATRIRCDPIVYLSVGRTLCRTYQSRNGFVDLDLLLQSRRSTETELRPVIDVKNFCHSGITYDLWRPNEWIRKK